VHFAKYLKSYPKLADTNACTLEAMRLPIP